MAQIEKKSKMIDLNPNIKYIEYKSCKHSS